MLCWPSFRCRMRKRGGHCEFARPDRIATFTTWSQTTTDRVVGQKQLINVHFSTFWPIASLICFFYNWKYFLWSFLLLFQQNKYFAESIKSSHEQHQHQHYFNQLTKLVFTFYRVMSIIIIIRNQQKTLSKRYNAKWNLKISYTFTYSLVHPQLFHFNQLFWAI